MRRKKLSREHVLRDFRAIRFRHMTASRIGKLVTTSIPTEKGDAILEIAFLMSATDGHLADEAVAFRDLVTQVRGKAPTKEDVDNLLERFVLATQSEGVDHRVREVAQSVPAELRETAFKVAVGLSLVDHDESAYEDEMVGVLGAVLGLADRAIPLAKEARKIILDE